MSGLGGIFGSKRKVSLHQLKVEDGDYKGLRLHLRFEEDGDGVLIINGSRVLFLNPTAADYVHSFIHNLSEEEAVKKIRRKYKVDAETALKDYQDVLFVVNTFAKTPDVCPVSYLGVDKMEPFSKELSAPYRMDLAITYRCNNKCLHCYAGGPRETKELTTDEWCRVMDKLQSLGIPTLSSRAANPRLGTTSPSSSPTPRKLGSLAGSSRTVAG